MEYHGWVIRRNDQDVPEIVSTTSDKTTDIYLRLEHARIALSVVPPRGRIVTAEDHRKYDIWLAVTEIMDEKGIKV